MQWFHRRSTKCGRGRRRRRRRRTNSARISHPPPFRRVTKKVCKPEETIPKEWLKKKPAEEVNKVPSKPS